MGLPVSEECLLTARLVSTPALSCLQRRQELLIPAEFGPSLSPGGGDAAVMSGG